MCLISLRFTGSAAIGIADTDICSWFRNNKSIVASIGLPEARLYALRDNYATEMLLSDASIKRVQDTLGHYSSTFTLDTYVGITGEMKKDAAEKMEGIIQKASGK